MDAAATPKGCTNFKLRRVTRLVSRHYDAAIAPCGLKTTQYSLLSAVLGLSPLRPVDLAQEMDLDASTLTRNLKPMVDAGWLALGEGADARSRLVSITDAGRAKRAEAQRLWRSAQRKAQRHARHRTGGRPAFAARREPGRPAACWFAPLLGRNP